MGEVGVVIGIIGTIIGCFIGLAGWLSGRDKKLSNDSEWRGGVNAKLDGISAGVNSTNGELCKIRDTLTEHATSIAEALSTAKSAHHRIDEIAKK